MYKIIPRNLNFTYHTANAAYNIFRLSFDLFLIIHLLIVLINSRLYQKEQNFQLFL